jgi:hypothetical protein
MCSWKTECERELRSFEAVLDTAAQSERRQRERHGVRNRRSGLAEVQAGERARDKQ